ncbi:flagellar basal body-associated FliL family protein [Actinoplanes sp. KI2]|uniref:flagellar basal body-associated FliL family protein n=1 Tax=Actinoplanes sp. KI2 TaxID=2983315 RepID=UPI0021D5D250|nr:flagellar basal body-associated FliL family protein [Actinoplanes sp. KI2]MCU7727131.1 flagellar basal body-associated FliL family protein [Actinoplanes sp. KI2]
MSDEREGADAPKKSNKTMMMIIIVAVAVLLGGGGGAFFMMKSNKSAASAAPKKGIVTPIDDALTVNLADAHYLKLRFAIQQTADTGTEAVSTAEAIELAIDEYTGRSVAELSTENGREAIKAELLDKVVKAYTVDGKQEVMDLYYTAFVTQ